MNERLPRMKITEPRLLSELERFVSGQIGRRWHASQGRDLADLACHPAAILSDGVLAVFAKFSAAGDARNQFDCELAGLELLARLGGARIPPVLGILALEQGCLLVLQALEGAQPTPALWRQAGSALARLHMVQAGFYGLEKNGYFGPLPMDNHPAQDWLEFYTQRRLLPYLKMAVDTGHLPPGLAQRVEGLLPRLPELCGPVRSPALLHGDAQQNNFIFTREGVYMIDPAVHYGHPEVDLAMLGIYQPVPEEVFEGYREVLPVDPGFKQRCSLWRIPAYLAAVAVEGAGYLQMLSEALEQVEQARTAVAGWVGKETSLKA